MSFKIPNEADAAFADQAEPDSVDFDILAAIHDKDGVLDGCAVTEDSPQGLFVAVASGTVMVDGLKASVTGADVVITAADGSNDRFDLVVVDSAGAITVVAGTASTNPVFPAIPATRVVLAAVFVPTSDTQIADNQITDKRILIREIATTIATYFIYDDGGTYRAVEGATGAVISQGTDAAVVYNNVKGADRRIVFGEGTFNLNTLPANSACINLGTGTENNSTIEGQGQGVTILKVNVASSAGAINVGTGDVLAIRNLTIDCNKTGFAGSPGQGIRALSVSNLGLIVERVEVKDADDRAMSFTSLNVRVENCWVHDCDGGIGFNSNSNSHVRCNFNQVHDIGTEWTIIEDGIFFGGQYGEFIGNTIYLCTDTGINIGGDAAPTGWAKCIGNTIFQIGNSGINTGGGDHQIIQGNIIFACGRKDAVPRSNSGVRIRDNGAGTFTSNDVIVTGNRIYEDDVTFPLDAGALGQLNGVEMVDIAGGGSPDDLIIALNDLRVIDAAPGGWTPILRTDIGTNVIIKDNLSDDPDREEHSLILGQSGTIPAATTNDVADFLVTIPFDMTLTRIKGVVKTKPSSNTTFQIRRSTNDGDTFANFFGTVVITAAGAAKSFSADPADLDVNEGDVFNYSVTVGGGDGSNALVEIIGVAR